MEIGKTLREARTRQGLSIHDAEDATKIRTRYLQALEQDDFETIPGSAFVMGFLRTYADYLGLDADTLVEEYRRQYDPRFLAEHRIPITEPQTHPRRRASRGSDYLVVAIVALIILLILAWIGWGDRTTQSPPQTSSVFVLEAGAREWQRL